MRRAFIAGRLFVEKSLEIHGSDTTFSGRFQAAEEVAKNGEGVLGAELALKAAFFISMHRALIDIMKQAYAELYCIPENMIDHHQIMNRSDGLSKPRHIQSLLTDEEESDRKFLIECGMRFQLHSGSHGQALLIEAMLSLPSETRLELFQRSKTMGIDREFWHTCLYGAMPVSRVIYELSLMGADIYFPTPMEDVVYKVDLVAYFPSAGTGFCIQIKSRASTETDTCILLSAPSTNELPEHPTEDDWLRLILKAKFWKGTQLFMNRYPNIFTPVFMEVGMRSVGIDALQNHMDVRNDVMGMVHSIQPDHPKLTHGRPLNTNRAFA